MWLSLIPRHREGGGEKGAPGVYCTRMRVNFQNFMENFTTSGHLHYTDFCEVADFYGVENAYHQPQTVWTMMRERWKHSAFQLQEWFTRLSIPAKCYYKQWRNLSFEVYRCLEQSNADHYHQSDIISDCKSFQMFLARSIALQCGLSADWSWF